MLFKQKSLAEIVKEVKSFGHFLMPYNYPKVPSTFEEDIGYIKSRDIILDGYDVIVYYNKADWTQHYLEILQITSKYAPFLPFSLVCKVAKNFLGDKELSYVDFMREGRKVYCWTVLLDLNNSPMPNPYKVNVSDRSYEGLCYRYLNPANVEFY